MYNVHTYIKLHTYFEKKFNQSMEKQLAIFLQFLSGQLTPVISLVFSLFNRKYQDYKPPVQCVVQIGKIDSTM
jgi:hypothetical protein